MADIVKRIPFEISSFGTVGAGGSYSLEDYQFDYALGGIPFLSATRDAWPYSEGMAEIRKQQFDSFAEPGEQSLYGWWLRSQSNFGYGAGLLYQDPDNDNQFNFRFKDSLGVDTWTSGQVGLLKVPNQQFTLSSTVAKVRGYVDGAGVDAAFYSDGNLLWKITDSGRTAASNPTVGTTLDLANTGTRTLINATDGIWSGIDTGVATQMYTVVGTPTSGTIEFAKNRVVWAWNNVIYGDALNTGAAVAPTVRFTHTDPNWTWSSITEGPTAIYAAGGTSTQSEIWKFIPDLSAGGAGVWTPTVTAVMPSGETIRTIFGYVGSFVGIATNKGFRVGEIDANGDISYGPLLFQPPGGCAGIAGFDRFMYVGSQNAHDAASGLFRVDLGTQVQEQTTRAVRYAYARDIYASAQTSQVAGVSTLGASGRLIFTISATAVWLQHATNLFTSGYLETGRIRFNTEEPKLYKFFSVRSPSPLEGNLQVDVLNQAGAVAQSITFTPTFGPATGDVAIAQPQGPQNYVSLKFTLNRGPDTTAGAVLNGWQMKALPGSIRQRMINHTFLLFDEEMDKGGQRVGTDGYARERFEDFKALARAGDVITFQELYEGISSLVVIDDWKFTQAAPPGPGGGTLGGHLTVVLRTVAEST